MTTQPSDRTGRKFFRRSQEGEAPDGQSHLHRACGGLAATSRGRTIACADRDL